MSNDYNAGFDDRYMKTDIVRVYSYILNGRIVNLFCNIFRAGSALIYDPAVRLRRSNIDNAPIKYIL